jgi:hypothetical protein
MPLHTSHSEWVILDGSEIFVKLSHWWWWRSHGRSDDIVAFCEVISVKAFPNPDDAPVTSRTQLT